MKSSKQQQQQITINFLSKEMGYPPSFFYKNFFKIKGIEELNDKQISNLIFCLRDRMQMLHQVFLYSLELGLIESIAYDPIKKNTKKIDIFLEKMGFQCPLDYMDVTEMNDALVRLQAVFISVTKRSKYKTSDEMQKEIERNKNSNTETLSASQLKCINTLVSQLKISKEEKELIVLGFSGGRASSSRDLSVAEATAVIKHLKGIDPNEKMRKKVFALAYEAGFIYGDTIEDRKMNSAKLNMFLREKGTVKKDLDRMNGSELVKVVTQFQQIVKHKGENDASKFTASLMAQLNIVSEKHEKQNH